MKQFVALFAAMLLAVAAVGSTFAQQPPKGAEGPIMQKQDPKDAGVPDLHKEQKKAQ